MVYCSTMKLDEQQLKTACDALKFTIGALSGSRDSDNTGFLNECRRLLTELGCNDNK